ncbi:MAG: hypothetical protein FNP40_13920 [Dehalobacter sp. 4CP]|uniref:hypothetical protein n=1 Tax=Dehalobacter sp. CP TaxID=2594474 RepID=UPI0013C70F6F|nr:hypothetical protein [Dehalobacter sp. 4CP]
MITNYPEKASLKEVLSSSLSITALKTICKNNGVFILSSDKDIVIRDAHLFYWGFNDINCISNYMEDEKNYKKSFRLKLLFDSSNIEADTEENTEIDAFDEFYSKLSTYRNTMASLENIRFESFNIVLNGDEKTLIGEISYKKRKPGKVELLSETTQKFSFQAKKALDTEIDIDFIFNDRGDIAIAKKIINTAIATSDNFGTPTQISLKGLAVPERVELFDRFFTYTFQDWRIDSIQNIKISDTEEILDEGEDEELEGSILNGIKSALLSGTGLRSNPIVIQAVDRGYFFPKATIMFEHRREAQKILVDITFNSDDLLLEIVMVATYEIEDGRPYKHPMFVDGQKIILEEFQDIIQEIYNQIRVERTVEAG